MLAAAAFNLKRVMMALLTLIQRWMILFLDWLEGFIECSIASHVRVRKLFKG